MKPFVKCMYAPHAAQYFLPEAREQYDKAFKAFDLLKRRVWAFRPDVIMVVSSEWPTDNVWIANPGPDFDGVLQIEGRPEIPYHYPGTPRFAERLRAMGETHQCSVAVAEPGTQLDPATVIPLRFVHPGGNIALLPISVAQAATPEDVKLFGKVIAEAVALAGERALLVGSGGLSCHFDPDVEEGEIWEPGRQFDQSVIDMLVEGRTLDIFDIAEEAIEHHEMEAGLRTLMLLTAAAGEKCRAECLDYHGIFGMGHAMIDFPERPLRRQRRGAPREGAAAGPLVRSPRDSASPDEAPQARD